MATFSRKKLFYFQVEVLGENMYCGYSRNLEPYPSYGILMNGPVIGRISELLFEGKIYSKVDNNSDAERIQQDLNELVCWSGT